MPDAVPAKRHHSLWVVLLAIVLLPACSAERADQAARPETHPEDRQPAESSEVDSGEAIDVAETETSDSAELIVGTIPAAEPMMAEATPPPPMSIKRIPMAMQMRSATEPAAESALEPATDSSKEDKSAGPFATLPAGASHQSDQGYATVAVFYATDRQRDSLPLSGYNITGNRDAVVLLGGCSLIFLIFAFLKSWQRRTQAGIAFAIFAAGSAVCATIVLQSGVANVEKRGVTYNAKRGSLVKGICEVTVPDTHERGEVERPSLLRFEIAENQQDHIVLTSAIELSGDDFYQRLSETVSLSADQDLLVFIHGYNVDFESAVQRTAQIAVDLPFQGVPICYSWPSQGKLLGYSVDETNAAWTQTHLKQFLLELAQQSGARSINVIAHSMGNRPLTGAIFEISWDQRQEKLFDRVVLAAPDVDADRFRRDLAPAISEVSNHVTLYASSDDQALIASKKVHGYPRAGESGNSIVVVSGVETIDVSGIDLSLLGHSYFGDNRSMLQDLYDVVRDRLPANRRRQLRPRPFGDLTYWQLIDQPRRQQRITADPRSIR